MGGYTCGRLLRVRFWSLFFWRGDVEDVFVLGFYFDLRLGCLLGFWGLRDLCFWFSWCFNLSLINLHLLLRFRLFYLLWFWLSSYSLFWLLSLLLRSWEIRLLFNFCNSLSLNLGCLLSYFLCWNLRSFILIIWLSWRFSMFTLEIFLFHQIRCSDCLFKTHRFLRHERVSLLLLLNLLIVQSVLLLWFSW